MTLKTIIDVLLEKNRLKPSEAARFGKFDTNQEIEKKLREEKLVSSEDIAKAYAIVFDLPFIRLENYQINPEAYKLIAPELIEKHKIIAFDKNEQKKIKIALGLPGELKNDPPAIISELKEKHGMVIDLYITTLEDIEKVLDREKPKPVLPKNIDLKTLKIPYDVITKFPAEISKKYHMVVFSCPAPDLIHVALSNPADIKVKEILDFVREKNQIKIEEYVAPVTEIDQAINLYYQKPAPEVQKPVEDIVPKPTQAPVPTAPQPEVKKPEDQASFSEKLGETMSKLNAPIHFGQTAPAPQVVPQPQNKIESLGENIVQRDITGIDTASPISHAPVVTEPTKVVPAFERKRFIRRPIPYQEQQEQNEQNAEAQKVIEDTVVNSVVAPENDLDKFLGQPVNDIETFTNIVGTGNIPQILAAAVVLAVNMKASDIHIEAEGQDLRIRFRVDGILKDIIKAPLPLHAAIISRIKILSRLKIDETRVPQDGRFDVRTSGHEIDLRVSTLPTVKGEKAALRILDKSQGIYTLKDLGLDGRGLKIIEENITKPYGVILSTGPTGSGKSTTLYSILKQISTPAVNVITLEDPVEYEMPGINQCQVKPKIGFTFAEGLRSVLRQDPNIIMVGEIRDAETAGMATHAALTGHLVLTTLHTNDAAGALPRLTNMGIEPFLITSSINVVIGQRLVRKLCSKCKHEAKVPAALMEQIEKELGHLELPKPYVFYEGAGCTECNNGFSGRVGIYEVLSMSEKIESLAIARRPASEIKEAAIAEGMITMKQDGLQKALKGLTTISEVLRVTLNE